MMTLDDETLGAYADGELDAATARQVEVGLSENDAARRRLSAIRRASVLSQASFAEVSREPVPEWLVDFVTPSVVTATRQVTSSSRPVWRVWLPAAVGAATLLIGIVIGSQFSPWSNLPTDFAQNPKAWRDQVVYFHSIYEDARGSERQALVDVAADDRETLADWFAGVVGPEVRIPELEHENFRLHGGRLLIAGRQPIAKLLYITNDERILGLSIMKYSGQQQGFLFEEVDGRSTLVWTDGTHAFALVGRLEKETLLRLAEQVATGFREKVR